jgi:hypothetical protein
MAQMRRAWGIFGRRRPVAGKDLTPRTRRQAQWPQRVFTRRRGAAEGRSSALSSRPKRCAAPRAPGPTPKRHRGSRLCAAPKRCLAGDDTLERVSSKRIGARSAPATPLRSATNNYPALLRWRIAPQRHEGHRRIRDSPAISVSSVSLWCQFFRVAVRRRRRIVGALASFALPFAAFALKSFSRRPPGDQRRDPVPWRLGPLAF